MFVTNIESLISLCSMFLSILPLNICYGSSDLAESVFRVRNLSLQVINNSRFTCSKLEVPAKSGPRRKQCTDDDQPRLGW